MHTETRLTEVTAPSYAPDGTRGYQITFERVTRIYNGRPVSEWDGTERIEWTRHGWVDRTADDGRAIATVSHDAWQYISVNRVADDEFTAEWVRDNARAICVAFGLNH